MTVITTPLDRADRALAGPTSTWRSALETLHVWRRRARERAELARFSERELRDIGLSASDAQREVDKPFWRP
jgi:uncharacterized protein YjiS (DUF1127 family)